MSAVIGSRSVVFGVPSARIAGRTGRVTMGANRRVSGAYCPVPTTCPGVVIVRRTTVRLLVRRTGFRPRRRSGCVDPFVGGGTEMMAVGVPSFGVVASQPPEDLASAGRSIVPARVVLENFGLECVGNEFSAHVFSDVPPGHPPRAAVDHLGQVQIPPVARVR
jgi:hypothetical protein